MLLEIFCHIDKKIFEELQSVKIKSNQTQDKNASKGKQTILNTFKSSKDLQFLQVRALDRSFYSEKDN